MKLINNCSIHWPRRVYVYRIVKGIHSEVYEVPSAAPGEHLDVTIGFKASKKNSVELFDLRLGYIDLYDGVVFFGPKFGFEIDTK